ncbi:MAG: hypothetical protein ABI769_16445 [Pseudomonadota bacterium]
MKKSSPGLTFLLSVLTSTPWGAKSPASGGLAGHDAFAAPAEENAGNSAATTATEFHQVIHFMTLKYDDFRTLSTKLFVDGFSTMKKGWPSREHPTTPWPFPGQNLYISLP